MKTFKQLSFIAILGFVFALAPASAFANIVTDVVETEHGSCTTSDVSGFGMGNSLAEACNNAIIDAHRNCPGTLNQGSCRVDGNGRSPDPAYSCVAYECECLQCDITVDSAGNPGVEASVGIQ